MRRLLLLLILLILSCSDRNPVNNNVNTENEGTAVIEAAFAPEGAEKAAAAGSTVSARVFFYLSGSLEISQSLQMSGRRATGNVTVKKGNYRVDLKGYDSSGDVTYFGSTSNVTINAGKITTVQITLHKGDEYQGIIFVTIPGGTFRMGDIQGGGSSNEKPVHTVTLSSFEMSKYEITQGQYEEIIGSNPSNRYGVGDDYPVYEVSWYDAVKFCNALSVQEGLEKCYNESTWECDFNKNGFRLPTEAEWEYACRAGTETTYYTGNNESDLSEAGWYENNSSRKTHPVGQKEPNAFGLYDMHGNVYEWCNEGWSSYGSDSVINPTGRQSGSYRVNRGGSWIKDAYFCRSADRNDEGSLSSSVDLGFRVVRRP